MEVVLEVIESLFQLLEHECGSLRKNQLLSQYALITSFIFNVVV